MTYAEDLAQMTRALVDVARHGQLDLTAGEEDVALLARRAVVDLLTTVHTDLTGLRASRVITRIDELEAHPVAALAKALHRHPRPPLDLAPSDALTLPVTTPPGRAWREVARHAYLAHHHWSAGTGPALDPVTRWVGVADVAAIARQLAALDVELADTLAAAGSRHAEAVEQLQEAVRSGLGVAARETARVAASGPQAEAGPDRDAELSPRRRIVVARSPADLIATQRRLAEFLAAAENVRPERLPQLAAALARCVLTAREQLPARDPSATALRGELREHARLLQETLGRPGAVVSVDPGDLRPLRQAAEALQGVRRHALALGRDRELLAGYVAAVAGST